MGGRTDRRRGGDRSRKDPALLRGWASVYTQGLFEEKRLRYNFQSKDRILSTSIISSFCKYNFFGWLGICVQGLFEEKEKKNSFLKTIILSSQKSTEDIKE